jgi:SAM-dependent methyltransferase
MDPNWDFPTDHDFEEYKRQHPDANYSTFYTTRTAIGLRKGKEHNSLGANIVTKGVSDFWETGAKQAQRLIALGKVSPASRVVEYGCGSLRIAGHFLKLLEPGNFFGLDVISDFYELGIANVGADLIAASKPRLAVISRDTVAEAAAFRADFVFAHSVVIHVHPDIIEEFFDNLRTIACRPGTILTFNVMISDEPVRYNNLGWAWPLEFFSRKLVEFDPMESSISKKTTRKGEYDVRGGMLSYRRKY